MSGLRIALFGAAGTGKTTIAEWLSAELDVPMNPVGSRSVAREMGFEHPYDVDKVPGARADFQRRLVLKKREWEMAHTSFVTDRTTMDNLAYTMMHDVHAIDEELLQDCVAGLRNYTHLVFCPTLTFCRTANDPARVHSMTYHRLYELLVRELVSSYKADHVVYDVVQVRDLEARHAWAIGYAMAWRHRVQ